MKWRWCFSIVLVLLVHHMEMELAMALSAKDVTPPLVPTTMKKTISPKWRVPVARPRPKIIPPTPTELAYLSPTHYLKSCPNLEAIIQQKVNAWVKRDYTMAASIIRLHFHDCAVRGCDASILLNHAGSERRALASKTLRGFELIDEIKAEVETSCPPKTVSCADILTAAARDATVMAGGPFWEVPFGRKDGRVSLANEANSVPQGHENVTALIEFFQARGLNILDLVILSGSHTIGRSTCYSIRQRLSTDNINLKYLNSLRRQCNNSNININLNRFVDLDATTPKTFDEIYYTNLEKKMGLLQTDQLLYSDARTSPLVAALASQPSLFFNQFAVSMIKLGNVQVRTAGEVRLNCDYVNP
ncbi:peroxidase 7-like [Camellia sinensis]|uniref:Peroxidase n=1 Tax=Camellia sinensis var. sinensis TaxID=542762 RepID=A0A4S4D376_CAMSN|nr:peroxidase 7-like [Camellia sinensis]THF95625.1 hypothetical protein TEA_015235 [Camellia sinensis var. sinensis]